MLGTFPPFLVGCWFDDPVPSHIGRPQNRACILLDRRVETPSGEEAPEKLGRFAGATRYCTGGNGESGDQDLIVYWPPLVLA